MVGENAPRALHAAICIIGKRNVGKSSLINAIAGQNVAIVSDTAGTTTDVVAKPYELAPIGPVVFYDTAGLDDTGELGERRMKATRKALYRSDMALIVVSDSLDRRMSSEVKALDIPFIVVFNKNDLYKPSRSDIEYCDKNGIKYISVSSVSGYNIQGLKDLIVEVLKDRVTSERPLVADLVKKDDVVVLVTPIDSSAPKGRLILPQVQVLRELLDADTTVLVAQELKKTTLKPDLIIADSQVIKEVISKVAKAAKVTTFSILFARNKGDLDLMVKGAETIDKLQNGDKILIAEACSHHAHGDDIGRVKIPTMISKYTGKELEFDVCSGSDFPDNLEDYALIVHCGGCMLNMREMLHRLKECQAGGIPVTNYGVIISKIQGVLERSTSMF